MSQCLNPNCLYENPQGTKFCQRCGNKIILQERYRPVRLIGEGGFGRTFQAIDEQRLDTPCVIKQFLPQQSGSAALEKATELFKQEAVRLKDLGKHPQIPDLLAFFPQEGRLYLIQEFINGQNLLEELQQKGKFSESEVINILTDILPILQFIHERKVIHRDIKPENIIRSAETGTLFLIDFGISKELTGTVLSRMGTITGTPGYAPPEQFRGLVYPHSDLYSLAVTCIRLLTGNFLQPDGSDLLFDAMKMQWIWKEKISVSQDLAEILDKMLQDIPLNRFQSATEILSTLKTPKNITNILSKNHKKRLIREVEEMLIRFGKESILNDFKSVKFSSEPEIMKEQLDKYRVKALGNYRELDRLLSLGKWKAADEETAILMCEATGRAEERYLRLEDINNLPHEDLYIIDNLWLKYSNGKFGFSAQKHIYQNLGGNRQYNQKIWEAFSETVGWKKRRGSYVSYYEIKFDIKALEAHLPVAILRIKPGLIILGTERVFGGSKEWDINLHSLLFRPDL